MGSESVEPPLKKTVAVDLDGVLASYDGWKGIDHIGEPIEGAQDFIRSLRAIFRVVIYTTRTSSINVPEPQRYDPRARRQLVERVQMWLDRHGFEVDGIHAGDGKPLCAAIIDDRAVSCRPEQDMRGTEYAYAEAQAFTMFLTDTVRWGSAQAAAAKADVEVRPDDPPTASEADATGPRRDD